MTIEREVKLAATAGMVVPDFSDVLPGVIIGPISTLQLDAVYYDTPTLSLARSGVTLRSRTGEPGSIWTLKVPASVGGLGLSRHELTFDAPIDAVPTAAREAARAYTRAQLLGPVARVRTERRQFALEIDGQAFATVCDDAVVAEGAAEPVTVFREIEVEVAPGSSDLDAFEIVVDHLRSAGCHPDETLVPKVVRALGARALDPPDVCVTAIGKHATAAMVVCHALSRSVAQLIGHHAGVRIGDDPEDLHQFRVASRRIRSDLRTFAPLLDGDWVARLREELAWLGTEVGIGRDADVLTDRLRSQIALLPVEDSEAGERLLQRLADTIERAGEHVVMTLSSDRYIALLDSLVEAAHDPHFATKPRGLADRSGRSICANLVRKPWRRLSNAVDALTEDSADTALHRVRILSKRVRYAAEAVAPLYGRDARRFASAIAEVQSVLGDHHDTTTAETWLRQAAKALPSTRLVVGELIAFERQDRARLRTEFTAVWKKVSRPKLRKWLA